MWTQFNKSRLCFHKTFEHKFFTCTGTRKKRPVITLDQINAVFWLDGFGEQVWKPFSNKNDTCTLDYKSWTLLDFGCLLEKKYIYCTCIFYRDHFSKNLDSWNKYYNYREPHNEELPAPFQTELNDFQRMLILRCIRPDKVCVPTKKYRINYLPIHRN